MNWISGLFGRKKEATATRISLADAEKLAAERTKPAQEALSRTLAGAYQNISEKKDALAEANSALEKARVGEEIHERLLKAALTNKDNIANQISAITASLGIPEEKDYDTALEFYKSSSRTIAECTQRSTVSYQYVKLVFEQESRDVREKAKQLEEAFISLKNELDGRKEQFELSKKISEAIRTMKEHAESKKELESRQKEANELEERLKKDLDSAKNGLEQLKTSEHARHLEGLKQELGSAEMELKNNRERAIAIISPVERVLKKFRRAAEEGRTKYSDLKQMDRYIANPAEALFSDKKMEICQMASEMRALTGTGEIEKDPKKAEKLLQSLGEINPETIRPILLRHESLTLKKAALEKKISGSTVEAEKIRLEARIKSIEVQVREAETESTRTKGSLLQLEEGNSKSKKELEKNLGELVGGTVELE